MGDERPLSFDELFAQLRENLAKLEAAKTQHDVAAAQVQMTSAAYEAQIDIVRELQRQLSDQMAVVLPSSHRTRSA